MTKTITGDREFREALSAFQAGRLQDAERLFEAVLRAEPSHIGALNLMGVVLMQTSRFAEAENYFRHALQQNSRSDATLYNYGIVLKALGRPAEALKNFSNALEINSSVAETWNNRGTVLNDLHRYEEAIADFNNALALNPRYAEAFYNKGKSMVALRRGNEASAAFEQALSLKPDLAEAWLGHANVLFEGEEYQKALDAYDQAVTLQPELVEGWLGKGNLLFALKRYSDALSAYERTLALDSKVAQAWLGRGKVFFEYRSYDGAFTSYETALNLDPNLAESWFGRANVLFEREQFDQALDDYQKSLDLHPGFVPAWLGIGNVYLKQKHYDRASAAYVQAEKLNPDVAEVALCRGNLFFALKKFDEAIDAYDKARRIKPELAGAWSNLGTALNGIQRFADALEAFDRALEIAPDLAEAHLGRGSTLSALNQNNNALAACDRAVELKPDLVEAVLGRGHAAFYAAQYDTAFLSYQKALTLKPDLDNVEGSRLLAKLHLCDWTDLEPETARLLSRLREGKSVSQPAPLLSLPSTTLDQLQCAERYAKGQPAHPSLWLNETYAHDRIRVAYLSGDFCDHAVAHLTAGLFENHDRSRFEITALSTGRSDGSAIRGRLEKAFEHFVDLSDKTDVEISRLIRDREVDILIDLMGYTLRARFDVLARRPAPIQVQYLGYAGTLGTNYIDYIIADATVIPEEHRKFYREQVVWLPDSYLANDNLRAISPHTPTRKECGLPENGFVFCSFNNSYKIAPKMFDIWMRLLSAVPNGVLWLTQAHPIAMTNLRREAERRRVSGQRIIFAPKVGDISDHLARLRLADLFLDTLPYNAHTTASDALWVGLPVLTCIGETFAGRVAASLLRATGLSELVTRSLEDYEALALRFANDSLFRTSIKTRLAQNRDRCPLFDTALFTRHIEAAYNTMWRTHQDGDAPAPFAVQSMAVSGSRGPGASIRPSGNNSGDR